MKIDFSDYKSLTEDNIVNITATGIEYIGGTIDFEECFINFSEHHNIAGKYIGEYDVTGSNPSLCFYTAPITTHVFFFGGDAEGLRNAMDTVNAMGYRFINAEDVD